MPDPLRAAAMKSKNDIVGTDQLAPGIAGSFLMSYKPLLLLIILSLLVYANTINNGYVLDDLGVIKENAYVAQGIKGIPTILTTPYLKGFRVNNDATTTNDLYRPLPLVCFAIERQLWGDWPVGNHLINIFLFAACVALLYLFLDALFDGKKRGVVFVACLLFALHPIHSEVVANIKSRDELLCFFFAFSCLILFVKYAESGKVWQLVAGAFCLFLSLLSKETSVSFVGVVPLIFFFYKNRDKKRSAYLSVVTVIVALAFIVLRQYILKINHAESTGAPGFLDNMLAGAPSLSSRIATAIMMLGYYARLLFVPYPLICDYGYHTFGFVGFGNIWALLSVLLYAGVGVAGIARLVRKKKDAYAFAGLFYVITIALFANIFILIGSTMAERFLFFPSVGFCLFISLLLHRWLAKGNDAISKKMWLALIPVLLIFAGLTIQRNAEWKDNYTLAKADAAKSPDNARLLQSLGYEETTDGVADETDPKDRERIMQKGIAHLERSITIYPGNSSAHNYLGNLFAKLQQYDSAEVQLKQAVALAPQNPVALCDLGAVYFARQQYAISAALCRQAQQISPDNVAVMNNIAMSYLQMRVFDTAIYFSQKALVQDPGNQLSAGIIAAANRETGKTDSAGKKN